MKRTEELSFLEDDRRTMPSVSVVIPLHNKKPHVARALHSALNQSRGPREILVVDDASTDGGMAEVETFSDPRLRLFHRDVPGPGGYAARNLAIENATGEWIAFLDADDEWLPDHLETAGKVISQAPRLDTLACLFSGYDNIYADGRSVPDPYTRAHGRRETRYYDFDGILDLWLALGDCPVWTSASVFRRQVLLDAGLFPAGRCARGGDKDLWFRALGGRKAAAMPGITAVFHRDSVNKVTKNASTATRHCLCATIEDALSIAPRERAERLKRLFNMEVFNYARQAARTGMVRRSSWAGFYAKNDPGKFLALNALSIPGVPAMGRASGIIPKPQASTLSLQPDRADLVFVVTMRNKAGAQLVAILIARELRRRGHRVATCFLYDLQPSFADEPDTFSLRTSPPRGAWDYLAISKGLYDVLRRLKPKTVHMLLPLANVAAAPLALAAGVPHRVASLHYPAETQNGILRRIDAAWGALGLYTGIVAVSQFVQSSLAKHPKRYRRMVTVIPNGMPERLPMRDRRAARRHFDIPEDAFVLGNVGRLRQQKNQAFLLEIMRHLPDVLLVIAGEGEERTRLERLMREDDLSARVRLIGNIPEEDIPDFLGAIDVFILTSHYEGLPLSVIEAMQAGVPILSSDIPAVREAVTGEGEPAAILAPLESVAPWVSAVEAVRTGGIDAEQLTFRARLRAEAFRVGPMADAYEALLLGDERVTPTGTRGR